MDAPLLALTRTGPARLAEPTQDRTAAQNLRQLMQLRWLAVAGQAATILFAHFALGLALPVIEMLAVVLVLALVNLATGAFLPRHRVRTREIAGALLIDMAALTLQLYFSGGADNPFVALYLLQVVLGAILLPRRGAAILLVAASLSYALLSVVRLPLAMPQGLLVDSNRLFAIGRWIAFAMVATLLVLFITRISRNLRARDGHLADLRQHAAEEEGIVRMGLFASGAAHELGTPLATLSVILADWTRVPAIAQEPDLAIELRDMQAELQRCKRIVSDILRSAGETPGGAMAGVPAAALLEEVADSWRRAHPAPRLDYAADGLGQAVVAAEPALRQAIWNLLENAAEAAGPAEAVTLAASGADGLLTIMVQDRGPGFPPEVRDHPGELYRSTKGAGHGVGLFLASTVARRLGGRIAVADRPGGGAEVRLTLPLARP